jgi:ABC-type glycerol-3-phosphate transport system substrate-binding protein
MGKRLLAAILLLLGGLLSACGNQGTNEIESLSSTITVLAELSPKADPIEQRRLKDLLQRQVNEFKRLHPRAQVKLRLLPSERLDQEIQFRSQRGLGPDLLLVDNTRDLLDWQARGYIAPIALSAQEQSNFKPLFLRHLRYRGQQLGLPLLVIAPLACFDRKRMPQPPQTFSDLIFLGQKGHAIGLNYGLSGLDELMSGFNVTLFPQSNNRLSHGKGVLRALQWMREANLQPHISFVADDEELRRGLEHGRFEWVPCSSGWLPSLRQSLGANLGIAILPAGPAGPARPLARIPTWAFGAQSSPTQRQLTKEFVMFTANIVNQRSMSLELGTVLPVNPSIALPLKAYPDLAIIDQAAQNSEMITLEQKHFLLENSNKAVFLVDQVITGVLSPAAAAPQFQSLLNAIPVMDSQS